MIYPPLAVGIITYNRLPQLIDVINAYLSFLHYPSDKLLWILSDDGSPDGYLQEIDTRFPHLFTETLVHQRRGMGHNWNRMIEACARHADFTLCCQDDWLLTEPIDLRLAVHFLRANGQYGMLRYHKLTGHVGLPSVIREWDTRENGITYRHGENEYVPEMLPYLDLLPPFNGSNTFSPYSGGVHMRTRAFTRCYGEYGEGVGFSNSEADYMERVNKGLRENPDVVSRVAMFPHYIESRFKDISPFSYRLTDVEKETLQQ